MLTDVQASFLGTLLVPLTSQSANLLQLQRAIYYARLASPLLCDSTSSARVTPAFEFLSGRTMLRRTHSMNYNIFLPNRTNQNETIQFSTNMCVCIYIYIYTYIISLSLYIYIYIHTHMHTYHIHGPVRYHGHRAGLW